MPFTARLGSRTYNREQKTSASPRATSVGARQRQSPRRSPVAQFEAWRTASGRPAFGAPGPTAWLERRGRPRRSPSLRVPSPQRRFPSLRTASSRGKWGLLMLWSRLLLCDSLSRSQAEYPSVSSNSSHIVGKIRAAEPVDTPIHRLLFFKSDILSLTIHGG